MADTLEVQLYDNNVKVRFRNSNHRYQVSINGGKWQYKTGTTTVLSLLNKPALMLWPMNMSLKYLRARLEAGEAIDAEALEESARAHTSRADHGKDTGTEVHAAVETYLRAKMEQGL